MRRVALAGCAVLLAGFAAAGPAAAASLRTAVVLHAPVVRLSDLFDGAGAEADRVLGPGPAPGARIVVEARQLAAIAQQFGVDWQPASPADRAVLERRGTLLGRDVVLAALRTALQGIGAPADAQIDLPGFSAPLVPPEANARADIEQLDYQGATGRFTGVLAVTGRGMDTLRLRLSGTLTAMVELPVAVRRLAAGDVIGPGDLRLMRLRATPTQDAMVQGVAQAVGLAARRTVMAGQPLLRADLMRPRAVRRGARVMMQLQAPGLNVIAEGQALEPGGIGDSIQVMNPVSRAVMLAEIVGPNRVRVEPGSAPLRPADGVSQRYSGAFQGVLR